MSNRQFYQKLILLIPVFEGELKFKRCLKSIEESLDLFDSVVISINGLSPNNDLRAIYESKILRDNVIILTTQQNLSALQHALWLTNYLKKLFYKHDRLLILAHDDEIRAQALQEWKTKISRFDSMVAWLGDYLITSDDSELETTTKLEKALPSIAYDQPLDIIQWLKHNDAQDKKFVFTNISGISVPLKAWIDMMNFRKKTGLGFGARTEYMLVAHRSISGIVSNSNPLVVIHQHENQQGRKVAPIDYSTDEVRYCLWLLLNSKNLKQLVWISRSRWGMKAIALNIALYLKLGIKMLFKTG
jgi:hypothetical protein